MWAAGNREAMGVRLGRLTVLLQLDGREWYLYSLLNTGGRLRMTGKSGSAQAGYNDRVATAGQSLGYFFLLKADVSAHLYFNPG